MVSDRAFLVLGGVGAVIALGLIWQGSKAVKAVSDGAAAAAEGVSDFVSNENVFSETADNAVNVISGGGFRDLGDVLMWITGKNKVASDALKPVPLALPSTAK